LRILRDRPGSAGRIRGPGGSLLRRGGQIDFVAVSLENVQERPADEAFRRQDKNPPSAFPSPFKAKFVPFVKSGQKLTSYS
jgi:hypothetical protein